VRAAERNAVSEADGSAGSLRGLRLAAGVERIACELRAFSEVSDELLNRVSLVRARAL